MKKMNHRYIRNFLLKICKFFINITSMLVFWDKDLRHRIRERLHPFNPNRCIQYLEQYCVVQPDENPVQAEAARKVIWQFWSQGLDGCPEIVRRSIQSVADHLPAGYTHIVLTEETCKDYVELPSFIWEAKQNNWISTIHFSDILRVWLLDQYGGVWVDATCLLTDSIPQAILDAPFFCYRSQGEFACTYIQSCFIKSDAHHPVTHKLCQTLERYWQGEGTIIHYFTFHFIFIALLRKDKAFREAVEQLHLTDDDAPMHYLFYALRRGRKYSPLLLEQAARQSFIHKLTYKEPDLFSDSRTDITLLVSTYNWPKALKLCIESASQQTVLPCEVIIADDGSGDETRQLILQLQGRYPELNIRHVWHPDEGFRRTVILNKALAQAQGEYIIQIDGDVVLEKHFIADHLELMEPGYYVCGSRTKVGKAQTEKILASGKFLLSHRGLKLSFLLNQFRNKPLRHYLALRYARKIDHMRGCNMAFWLSDFLRVNGYNEDLLQWGHEDSELIYRMHFAGVQKKALKMGGVLYHLWHPEASRSNEDTHLKAIRKIIEGKVKWCENGIDKYDICTR